MDTNSLLDAAKTRLNLKSDNELAAELGYTRQWVSDMRKKGLSATAALQLATLLNLPHERVLADIEAERETDPTVKAVRKKIADSLRSALGVAAMVAVALMLSLPPKVAEASALSFDHAIHYTRRLRRWLAAVLAIFSLTVSPVYADELRVGIGQNWTGGLHTGAWQQDGFPDNKNKNYGPVYALDFIGRTPVSWLDYQIGLAYRKGASAWDSVYITDPCYADGMYAGGPVVSYNGMATEADCDRRFYLNRVETDTKAVTVAIVPTYRRDNWALSLALGVSIHHTEVRIDWDQSRGAFADVARDVDSTWTEHGTTYYVAPSLRVGHFFITGYYAYGETAPESMGNGNRGFYTGVSFPL